MPGVRAKLIPLLLTLVACASGSVERGFPYIPMTLAPPAKPASTPEPVDTPPPPPVEALPLDVDPVEIGLTAEGITRLCEGSLERARLLTDEIRALKGEPEEKLTWAATLGKLDAATLALRNAADFPELIAVVHPDKAVRDAAKACDPKVDRFITNLYLDADLASIFKRYAARKEK
ncbi:MAG: hypothetical protein RMJ98_15050, partial [Myxococcales bacterium]|nr:oligopeptidase A [Polyangiaceae bacterium]MDW8250610.1 hypothetical protein [Myxococcales bacterium]